MAKQSRKLLGQNTDAVLEQLHSEFGAHQVGYRDSTAEGVKQRTCAAAWGPGSPAMDAYEAMWFLKNEHNIDSDLQEVRDTRVLTWQMAA